MRPTQPLSDYLAECEKERKERKERRKRRTSGMRQVSGGEKFTTPVKYLESSSDEPSVSRTFAAPPAPKKPRHYAKRARRNILTDLVESPLPLDSSHQDGNHAFDDEDEDNDSQDLQQSSRHKLAPAGSNDENRGQLLFFFESGRSGQETFTELVQKWNRMNFSQVAYYARRQDMMILNDFEE